jgi:phosphohistidine phosphatase
MGNFVRGLRLTPDIIISSDALRARLTAEAFAEAALYTDKILLDPRLYLAGPSAIVRVLRTVRENAETVMIVGHNPGLEELVARLTGEPNDMPTAALAQIALPIDRWRSLEVSTGGTLLALWQPKDIA